MESGIKVIDESRQGEALMLNDENALGKRRLYLESYGCAMNFSDSEIIASVLKQEGYVTTSNESDADLILLNTCAIRDNAELRVRNRLNDFKKRKKTQPGLIIGVMGCMAERLKSQLLEEEKLVDLVVGPDSYRDLPKLIETVEGGQKAINVLLSREETYADINPIRFDTNGVTAFVSIMRGCDNMCAFCVVPYTRGRERSRDPESIIKEVQELFNNGYKEVTLLEPNVDSYLYYKVGLNKDITEEQAKESTTFAMLLEKVAQVSPWLRVRFSTSHPKDLLDDVLEVMARYENICKYVHLPVQSGSDRILELMNRGYTREWYKSRIESIRKFMPEAAISSDFISGFCTETEEDHKETLELIQWGQFDFSYMFKYSERPKTLAERSLKDDISEEIKSRRLAEIVELQQSIGVKKAPLNVGKVHRVLVEGLSKKSDQQLSGRNSQNMVVVFDKEDYKKGDYVDVMVNDCKGVTLIGKAIKKVVS